MRPWILLLLSGCLPIEWGLYPPEPERGTFGIAIDAVPVASRWADKRELKIEVEELILEAVGPTGPESVGSFVEREFEPFELVDAITFSLPQGTYTEVSCTLTVASTDGDSAIELELEGEEARVQLEVDTVELSFAIESFEVGPEQRTSRILFDPQAWVTALGLDHDEGEWEIGPESELYGDLLRAIEETTTYSPTAPGAPLDPDDDDDGEHEEADDGSTP